VRGKYCSFVEKYGNDLSGSPLSSSRGEIVTCKPVRVAKCSLPCPSQAPTYENVSCALLVSQLRSWATMVHREWQRCRTDLSPVFPDSWRPRVPCQAVPDCQLTSWVLISILSLISTVHGAVMVCSSQFLICLLWDQYKERNVRFTQIAKTTTVTLL